VFRLLLRHIQNTYIVHGEKWSKYMYIVQNIVCVMNVRYLLTTYHAHGLQGFSAYNCVQPEYGKIGAETCSCIGFLVINVCVWRLFIVIIAYKTQRDESY
jgi:hypothetical protein